jgi:ankyrin repeat protein
MYKPWALLLLTLVACGEQRGEPLEPVSLLDASERGDQQQIARLLDEHQPVDMRDACLFTPLMKAAMNGHLDAVKQLVQAGARVDSEDKGGYTALMLAASNNYSALVDYLAGQGAVVDHVEQTNGWTALIWASNRGHQATVERLLHHHADPARRDHEGLSAADHARRAGHEQVLSTLLGVSGQG